MESRWSRVACHRGEAGEHLVEVFERVFEARAGRSNQAEVVDAVVLFQDLQEYVARHSIELGRDVRAKRFPSVHGYGLFTHDVAIGKADQQVHPQGDQGNVEGWIAARVDVHDRANGGVVPCQVVLVVDCETRPARADWAYSIGCLLAVIDAVFERPRGCTTDRAEAHKEPDSQLPPHGGRL